MNLDLIKLSIILDGKIQIVNHHKRKGMEDIHTCPPFVIQVHVFYKILNYFIVNQCCTSIPIIEN